MALGLTDISVPLVRNTLGESTDDVGNLCKSGFINKWAKYKPVVSTSLGLASDDQFTIMKSANFGLTAVEMPGIVASSFRGATQSTLAAVSPAEWSYAKPTGGASSPYRLGDFRQYRHDAKPFVTGLSIPDWYSGLDPLGVMAMTFKWGDATYQGMGADIGYIDINLTELNIQALDFANEEWRVGIACVVGNYYYIASSLWPIKDITGVSDVGKAQVDLTLSTDITGYLNSLKSAEETTVTFIPFLAYRMQYVIETTILKYFKFLSGGKAFCLPKGDSAVTMKVFGGVKGKGMTIAITSLHVKYPSISYDVTVNLNATYSGNASDINKPATAANTGLQVVIQFTMTNPTAVSRTYDVTKFLPVLAGATALSRQYVYDTANSGTNITSITIAAGATKTLEIAAWEGSGDSNKPISAALQILPAYAGTEQTTPSISAEIKFDSTSMYSKSFSVKMH